MQGSSARRRRRRGARMCALLHCRRPPPPVDAAPARTSTSAHPPPAAGAPPQLAAGILAIAHVGVATPPPRAPHLCVSLPRPAPADKAYNYAGPAARHWARYSVGYTSSPRARALTRPSPASPRPCIPAQCTHLHMHTPAQSHTRRCW